MPVQSRARIVCVSCHERKVKCDLQNESGAECRECRRLGQPCIRRLGARKRRRTTGNSADISNSPAPVHTPTSLTIDTTSWSGNASTVSPRLNINQPEKRSHDDFAIRCTTGLAFESVDVEEALNRRGRTLDPLAQSVLQSSEILALPRQTLLRALVDNFTHAAFHHCPVADHHALKEPQAPVLLVLATCMIGNYTKQEPSSWSMAEELHNKVKLLLAIDFEEDAVRMLQTVCLMSLWYGRPSTIVSLDGPDYWIGVGIRLAQVVGLHREETYGSRQDASLLRRIFWQLHNHDAMQVAFWGRPPLLRHGDFTVRLPSPADFETSTLQSLVFIESTKLWAVMSQFSESAPQNKRSAAAVDALVQWLESLPADLLLYDRLNGQRRDYNRAVSELWIQYFVTVILSQTPRHSDHKTGSSTSAVSLVAASCIVTLYDEMYCRADLFSLLPLHGFYYIAASLPIIYAPSSTSDQEAWRNKRLQLLQGIVSYLRPKFGDADMVTRKVEGLRKKVDEWRQRAARTEVEDLDGVRLSMSARESLLFPFPDDICDYMDCVYTARERLSTEAVEEPLLDSQEGALVDYGLFDMFDFTFDEDFNVQTGDATVALA